MHDCASSNKIKENKYKILRMSLLLGSDENREETLNNFEDAARDIDIMNDEIYQRDIEDKFYDTLKLEEEEKKLAVLVDYIGGRVEQRISLLSDFANVTGFDLQNLPPIKYYDKLDDYKERLKYIREYLDNTDQINSLNTELEVLENKLKEAYLNKATSEENNQRNEEIIQSKFNKIIKTLEQYKEINEENIDQKLNEIISQVEDSQKSLDIFTKSFQTLSGSGISYEEEEEYHSYVENAETVYYTNKEQEFLLRIYKLLLSKETEYSQILFKREQLNDILYERLNLRKELQIEDMDILSNLYDLLERQYEEIKRQRENIENIDLLNEDINNNKERVNELELANQKVEILALLREFCIIDTYNDLPEIIHPETSSILSEQESSIDLVPETTRFESSEFENTNSVDLMITTENIPDSNSENDIFSPNGPIDTPTVDEPQPEKEVQANQVVSVANPKNIDLEFVHAKANKVMQRVGEMLGIKPPAEKIVNITTEETSEETTTETTPKAETSKVEEPKTNGDSPFPPTEVLENPMFNNTLTDMEPVDPEVTDNNFWFPSDTPDALNELPDLEVSTDNFFTTNNIPDLNFPDLKIDFGTNDTEDK